MKMIVTDLDGTLLNKESKVPLTNIKALELIKEKGIEFVIASGRSFYSLDYFTASIGLKGAGNCGIGFNGCVVYKNNDYEILHQVLLGNRLMHEITDKLKAFDSEFFAYASNGKLLAENLESDNFKAYHALTKNPYTEIPSLDTYEEDIYKIFVRDSNEKLRKIYKSMGEWTEGKCNMFFSADNLMEFTSPSATKGNALKFLAQYKGIDLSEVVAMGDNYNDMSMIQYAGVGVGMANAVPELKQSADYVTKADCNEGALAEVLNAFF